jgi:hypothetical protein
MTSHVARLYAIACSVAVFFVAWAALAARPWVTPTPDPAVAALAQREQRLHAQSVAVKRLLDRRWAAYRVALKARQRTIASRQAANRAALASAPAVRVVTLPALTITRTS